MEDYDIAAQYNFPNPISLSMEKAATLILNLRNNEALELLEDALLLLDSISEKRNDDYFNLIYYRLTFMKAISSAELKDYNSCLQQLLLIQQVIIL